MVLLLLLPALSVPSHHVVVSVLGLQHDNNLLQVLQVSLVRTFRRAEDGDDAFSDVGQIDSLCFFHDCFPSHGHPTGCENESHGKIWGSENFSQQMFAEFI